MKISFVTSNTIKTQNAARALAPFGVDVEQIHADLIESRSFDPAVIVAEKADQAFELLKTPVMVEDSGFFIRALGGFPMTHVKFSLQTLGIRNILKMLEGVDDRHAEWRMSVAYTFGKGQHKVFTFVEPGEIAREERTVKRPTMSDYWKIYIPKLLPTNTLALSEMEESSLEEWRAYQEKHNQFTMLGEWIHSSNIS